MSEAQTYDVVIIGAGTAGLPAAILAAQRGARVLVLEAAADIGGTLHWSSAQMSAAGARRQKAKGITDDHPDRHFADVMRISNGNANPALVRFAVDHAAGTLDWLEDNGFDFDPVCPTLFYGHQAYGKARTYWGMNAGFSLLDVFRPLLEAQIKAGRVTLKLNARFRSLITEDGAVVGVIATAGDAPFTARGKNIVLTAGGYAANVDLYREIQNRTQYQKAFCPTANGDGLVAARAIGADIVNGHLYTISTLTVLKDDTFPSPLSLRVNTLPQNRPPWEIWVNTRGERFVAEDEPIIDVREKALERQPDKRMWIVFDDVIRRESPDIIMAWFEPPHADPYATHKAFARADSIEELARICGLPAATLAATIADFNKGLAHGRDRFGRTHMPRPIAMPPFHAIRQQGGALSTTGGLAVDNGLRVLKADGVPIPNLYAAGEQLGAGQTMGDAAVGGMMVTPALTFGRLLGQTILRW